MSEHCKEHDWITDDNFGTGLEYCNICHGYKMAYDAKHYKQALEDVLDVMPEKLRLPLTIQIRDIIKEALKDN